MEYIRFLDPSNSLSMGSNYTNYQGSDLEINDLYSIPKPEYELPIVWLIQNWNWSALFTIFATNIITKEVNDEEVEVFFGPLVAPRRKFEVELEIESVKKGKPQYCDEIEI